MRSLTFLVVIFEERKKVKVKKKERNKINKERKVRSLTFCRRNLYKKEKFKVKRKERKKESCELWFVTSKEKRKESRQVVGKAD